MSPSPNASARPFRVLMVCTGNICRSTMAQEVLDEAVSAAGLGVRVDSAGISDEEQGRPIDARAARALRDAGHGIPDHRARRVRAGELGDWDLVLAMTRWHLASLRRLADRAGVRVESGASPGTPGVTDLRLFRAFDPGLREDDDPDLPDPWYGTQQDFTRTLRVIERATPGVVAHVREAL
ncbi:low molecular weight phosphotyrosine protein phosphatase [Schaalia naturae]|uniref:protein-tyrosine-phosphatase n=1 Tax=Schaalia naturae TaxID=635203 RepID=A0ABW2SNV3_9ACTO